MVFVQRIEKENINDLKNYTNIQWNLIDPNCFRKQTSKRTSGFETLKTGVLKSPENNVVVIYCERFSSR